MTKLKVNDNGIIKKVDYTSKFSDGIFIVAENKIAKKNCEILNIKIEGEENQLAQEVTKLGKTAILTTKVLSQYFQYIIKDYTKWDDFQDLLSQAPGQSREALSQTYNLTKMDDMKDFDLLGNALDNQN
jgi:hypothetical protein